MGNRSSVLKDKKQEIPIMNFKKLNENNTEFLTKLNEIATDYILGQNFQDMVKLTNSKYCDDLVIITSKILKKSFFSKQIQTIYQSVVVGSDSQTGVGSIDSMNDLNEPISNEKNRQMCIEIAKYYVKVAHLFAAIITTLNPVFSWKSSASSSRAILSPHIPEPPPQSQAPTDADVDVDTDVDADVAVEDNVAITALENKQYIPEMAKNVKVENLNFCNSRISDLIDMEEISDLIDGKNSIQNKDDTGVKSTESEIKIKTKLCSSNLNNIDSVGRNKTVYDLPGFAELTRLYNDKYNASKGRFDRMSAKSKEEKKRNVDLLYTLFTGDPKPPKDIKNFRDIPLHSFSDTADCSNIDSLLNKTYTGTTKDKLFVDYVEQIKKMIYESNMIRNSLLEIIDSIFVSNTDSVEAPIKEDPESRMKYMIDPELTYERLNELITESRKIILKLYVNCEKNFIYTLKILQAIIETQMFETGQRQIRELERNIDAEY